MQRLSWRFYEASTWYLSQLVNPTDPQRQSTVHKGFLRGTQNPSLKAWERYFLGLSVGLFLSAPVLAQDFVEPRTYLQFRSGEFDTAWDVHDYWGLSVGHNFNGHWGVEIAGDVWERYLDLGEESINAIIPQVRYRYPLLNDRLVPYAIAGVGGVFLQLNDVSSRADGRGAESEGVRLGASIGGGIEYFFNNNMAFVLEGKYVWVDSMDFTVDGHTEQIDMSNALVSFGLRAYFEEIPDQPYAEESARVPSRYYFLMNYGGSVITDKHFDGNVRLGPEPSAIGDVWNQSAGLGFGANFGRHWGVEATLSGEERRLIDDNLGTLGEYAVVSIIPRLRLRAPMSGGRWVPYAFGGIGLNYGEFNDGKGRAEIEGTGFYPASDLGVGFEWFVARNISFHADALWNYTWGHEIRVNSDPLTGSFSTFQMHFGFRLYLWESRRDDS